VNFVLNIFAFRANSKFYFVPGAVGNVHSESRRLTVTKPNKPGRKSQLYQLFSKFYVWVSQYRVQTKELSPHFIRSSVL